MERLIDVLVAKFPSMGRSVAREIIGVTEDWARDVHAHHHAHGRLIEARGYMHTAEVLWHEKKA